MKTTDGDETFYTKNRLNKVFSRNASFLAFSMIPNVI